MEDIYDITLQEMVDQAGLKQREIAKLWELHESTVSLKLSGKRKVSLEEAIILARYLNTSLDQIYHALNFAICKEDAG
ncbi:helix-turn-helix transcriptional regulator [Desulfitobacterium sp.]|uniref:helix-turn-helix transcriptional regulator n=1 Tax=Desulfitobacterium sp. TaxID=49981 RepID=UPI002C119B27|nr:helix-turn-helix transcriptional regulator [Desulfitobacterium sp.]HVJ49384.1 helix-turn-helix transcriptional regulator [Desulfitobacterium sp.]